MPIHFLTLVTSVAEIVSEKDETAEAVPVLVVDDDVAILELCARLLTSRGYAIDMAMNAEEALRRVLENSYRVILLDLKLPGMDGMACMRRLKEQGCRAEIVIVTGYATIPTAVEAMTVGALDFLEKPFNPCPRSPSAPAFRRFNISAEYSGATSAFRRNNTACRVAPVSAATPERPRLVTDSPASRPHPPIATVPQQCSRRAARWATDALPPSSSPFS